MNEWVWVIQTLVQKSQRDNSVTWSPFICLSVCIHSSTKDYFHGFKQGSILGKSLSLATSPKELADVPSVLEMSSQVWHCSTDCTSF